MKLSIPLVGMQFRPPAVQVLVALPLGTEVMLRPDPSNEYDANAVRVVVDLPNVDVKKEPLRAMLEGTEFDVDDVTSHPLQLGFLAATGGKPAAGGPGNVEALALIRSLGAKLKIEVDSEPWKYHRGKLSCLPDGRPCVDMEY